LSNFVSRRFTSELEAKVSIQVHSVAFGSFVLLSIFAPEPLALLQRMPSVCCVDRIAMKSHCLSAVLVTVRIGNGNDKEIGLVQVVLPRLSFRQLSDDERGHGGRDPLASVNA